MEGSRAAPSAVLGLLADRQSTTSNAGSKLKRSAGNARSELHPPGRAQPTAALAALSSEGAPRERLLQPPSLVRDTNGCVGGYQPGQLLRQAATYVTLPQDFSPASPLEVQHQAPDAFLQREVGQQLSEFFLQPEEPWTNQTDMPMPPSLGSAMHGVGLCKPCAFIHKAEGCHNGAQCEFCHLCEPGEKKKRKKDRKLHRRSFGMASMGGA
eukprot:TRINITY_DN4397_c0_g1_i1.p1 TRINITY_DN4397_c0_g1~~TRINITY_DN4397_c0_g1_i1.p1  ORF type:complete len:211 (+),score=40.68 TRINITY_DN4397_c0_g1_i1:104-736(+)